MASNTNSPVTEMGRVAALRSDIKAVVRRAPLWAAAHLPHLGGDQQRRRRAGCLTGTACSVID